jgi:hypothetical protein
MFSGDEIKFSGAASPVFREEVVELGIEVLCSDNVKLPKLGIQVVSAGQGCKCDIEVRLDADVEALKLLMKALVGCDGLSCSIEVLPRNNQIKLLHSFTYILTTWQCCDCDVKLGLCTEVKISKHFVKILSSNQCADRSGKVRPRRCIKIVYLNISKDCKG